MTYPRAGNIGGGGYMVIHLARTRAPECETTAIDYRETAPAAITRDVFLDANGEADPRKSRDSALAIGVPGTVAGLALAHEKYGSGAFTLAELIAPAIRLAREGIDRRTTSRIRCRARSRGWRAGPPRRRSSSTDGSALGPGDTLVQRRPCRHADDDRPNGPRAFYQGPIADRIVAAVRAAGGV